MKKTRKKAVTLSATETPRDCVVVFEMPHVDASLKLAKTLIPGTWYRTWPMSFPEASKRCCHYLAVTRAYIVPVSRFVLDNWSELQIPEALAEKLYADRTPRVSIVDQVRKHYSMN